MLEVVGVEDDCSRKMMDGYWNYIISSFVEERIRRSEIWLSNTLSFYNKFLP